MPPVGSVNLGFSAKAGPEAGEDSCAVFHGDWPGFAPDATPEQKLEALQAIDT